MLEIMLMYEGTIMMILGRMHLMYGFFLFSGRDLEWWSITIWGIRGIDFKNEELSATKGTS